MKQFGIFDNYPIGPSVYAKRGGVDVGNEAERFSTKGRFRLHVVSVKAMELKSTLKGDVV